MRLCLLLIGFSTIAGNSAYVLLQVRKGDNQSNVDALIHKVVPSPKYQKLAETARKQFDSYNQYHVKNNKNKADNLESIVVAIDSGASPDENGKSDAFDRVVKKLSGLLQMGAMKYIPKYRTKLEKFHIKPEIVHFKSGKPSVMFEINTKEVMRSVHEFLSSKAIKKYTDQVANKAAVIYRTMKTEIMKDQ